MILSLASSNSNQQKLGIHYNLMLTITQGNWR